MHGPAPPPSASASASASGDPLSARFARRRPARSRVAARMEALGRGIFEWVDDDGILLGRQGFDVNQVGGVDLWEITATASWALVDGVDFRVEYRHNDANKDIFGDSATKNTDTQDVIQAQLVWYPEL